MHRYLSFFAILALLNGCGEDGESEIEHISTPDEISPDSTPSSDNNTTNSAPEFLVDTTGGEVNIPPTIPSSATSMNTTIVPDDFSYNSAVEQKFTFDIRAYSTAPSYVSIYREFTQKEDGSFKAHYNSRIISAPLENGEGTLHYVSSKEQYYVLAEVWFYDHTNPIQKRIPNTDTQWIW